MKGAKIAGRVKGTPNKNSALAKENVLAVFTRLGGTATMAQWAKENQTEFYKIYARLLPIEGPGPNGEHTNVFELVAPWMSQNVAKRNG